MSTPRRPHLRISDAERDSAVSALGEHYAAGRLTREEYDERSAQALAAKTAAELAPLFADLPSLHGSRPAETVPSVAPARPGRGRGGLPLLPIFLVVLGIVLLTHVPWPLVLLVAVCWWSGVFRRAGSRHGGWRPR